MNEKPSEEKIRRLFNHIRNVNASKQRLHVGNGGAKHEFDLYEISRVIGGISTSPWTNRTGSTNTGGQDRLSTELLWLTLWEGKEARVVIVTDMEMAQKLLKRFQGCSFPRQIEIVHFDAASDVFTSVGFLP